MAQLPLFRCQKNVSGAGAATAAVTPIDGGFSGGDRQCLPSCGGGIGRRLVRKLKKQSKMLRTAAAVCRTSGGGAAFQCQYDPLSYSRNFDGCSTIDDDSSYFYYTFSSRFARPLAATH